jgi:hypothetical protein
VNGTVDCGSWFDTSPRTVVEIQAAPPPTIRSSELLRIVAVNFNPSRQPLGSSVQAPQVRFQLHRDEYHAGNQTAQAY